jgi:hypothetical protein
MGGDTVTSRVRPSLKCARHRFASDRVFGSATRKTTDETDETPSDLELPPLETTDETDERRVTSVLSVLPGATLAKTAAARADQSIVTATPCE